MSDIQQANEEKVQEKNAFFSKVNVPMIIMQISMIYIILVVIYGIFDLVTLINQQNDISKVLNSVIPTLNELAIGFVFWGVGQFLKQFR